MAVMSPEGVVETERDLELVRWLGEMYGAPMSVFGLLIERYGERGVAESSRPSLARYHAVRLERLGFAVRRRLLGRQWILPTPAGIRHVRLPFEAREPAPSKATHVAIVGRLRLYLESQHHGARWESERWVRHWWREDKIEGLRIPDGILLLPDGRQVAIEVELHRKLRDRYPRLLRATSSSVDAVWWFVPAIDVDWLSDLIDSIHERPPTPHVVHELPGVVISP